MNQYRPMITNPIPIAINNILLSIDFDVCVTYSNTLLMCMLTDIGASTNTGKTTN